MSRFSRISIGSIYQREPYGQYRLMRYLGKAKGKHYYEIMLLDDTDKLIPITLHSVSSGNFKIPKDKVIKDIYTMINEERARTGKPLI